MALVFGWPWLPVMLSVVLGLALLSGLAQRLDAIGGVPPELGTRRASGRLRLTPGLDRGCPEQFTQRAQGEVQAAFYGADGNAQGGGRLHRGAVAEVDLDEGFAVLLGEAVRDGAEGHGDEQVIAGVGRNGAVEVGVDGDLGGAGATAAVLIDDDVMGHPE